MALLKYAVLVAASCYSPDLRDCTVTCAAATDCASGQVCNGGLCSGPSVQCAMLATPDAAIPPPPPNDAAMVQPDAKPDAAPPMIPIHVHIDGVGHVTLDGGGDCNSPKDHADCDLSAPEHVLAMFHAKPADHFDHWSDACGGAGMEPDCALVPNAMPLRVTAKFRGDGG
jgi:hypothetical protein